jgi:hypothetical protein
LGFVPKQKEPFVLAGRFFFTFLIHFVLVADAIFIRHFSTDEDDLLWVTLTYLFPKAHFLFSNLEWVMMEGQRGKSRASTLESKIEDKERKKRAKKDDRTASLECLTTERKNSSDLDIETTESNSKNEPPQFVVTLPFEIVQLIFANLERDEDPTFVSFAFSSKVFLFPLVCSESLCPFTCCIRQIEPNEKNFLSHH